MEKQIVVTDSPKLTGYLHGAEYGARRQTSDPKQQVDYETGYRSGVKDKYKLSQE